MTRPPASAANSGPDSRWEHARWPLALGAGALLAFLALVAHGGLWARLGIEHFSDRPYFLDLVAVLAAGQAHAQGLDVYVPPNPFDPFGRPHCYGPWWLATGGLGLTVADARWLGPLLALVFVVAAVAVLAPRRAGAAAVALALLASPPVLLALERGNNDLVIFILLAGAGGLLARPGVAGGPAGAALVWLAAALKIYPVAALPALAARPGPRGRTVLWLLATGAGCAAVFAVWRTDYARAAEHQFRPDTVFAYGLGVLPWMLEWPARVPAGPPAVLAGAQWTAFAAVALGTAWWLARRARALWELVPATGAVAAWHAAGGATWCACWLANANYPYRAVLLLLPARLWLGLAFSASGAPAAGAGTRQVARALLACALVAFWLTPVKAVLLDGYFTGLAVAFGAEQALMLALTAALLTSLAGWAWRRWQLAP